MVIYFCLERENALVVVIQRQAERHHAFSVALLDIVAGFVAERRFDHQH